MKRIYLILVLTTIVGLAFGQKGYQADVFVDAGIMLNSDTKYAVFDKLGLTSEAFVAQEQMTEIDTLLQSELLGGNVWDENGILLYPDGSPRYRILYVNRGKAGQHGKSISDKGRQAIEKFVRAGGGYVGTCAAAFLMSKYLISNNVMVPKAGEYLALWSGATESTLLGNSWTHMTIEPSSPLLKYSSFGGKMVVDSISHSGGCYAVETKSWPKGTEVLARYLTKGRNLKKDIDGLPSIWAYRESDATGRIVVAGSQLEEYTEGTGLELMSSMIQYALDANRGPVIKRNLNVKDCQAMITTSAQASPSNARIGDGQYHHFTVEIPKNANKITVILSPKPGWENFDLYLYAKSDGFAFSDNAKFKCETSGINKKLVIDDVQPGSKYYISVYCATKVDVKETSHGVQYSGKIEALNGIPYYLSFE